MERIFRMNEFTQDEIFDWFKSIFSYCGTFLLKMNDEDIMYYLFEELDSDATSCLHINTLQDLKNNGYIDEQMLLLCQTLREQYMELNTQKPWSAEEIRRDEKWLELFHLADTIKKKIN